MRAYVLVTGIVFALILVAHAARVAVEGGRLLREPDFVAASVACLVLVIWAVRVLKRSTDRERRLGRF